jgi:hypothetical protein
VGQCIHDEEEADFIRYLTMEYPRITGKPMPKKYGYLSTTVLFYKNFLDMTFDSLFFRQLSKEYGLQFVGGETFSPTATDVTPQLTRLRDKGAEVILTVAPGGEGAAMVKTIRSLGMHKTYIFNGPSYGFLGDTAKIVGLKNMEGLYTETCGGNSIDDPDQRGVKESRLIFTNIAGYKLFTGCNSAMCLRIADGAFVGAIIGPLKEITTWKEFEEEDFKAIQTKMAEHPELLLRAAERGIFEKANHKYSAIEGGPLLYLPGKISQQHSQIWQWQEGKYGMGMYDVQRQNGSHWDWVPPNVIPVTNPTAPRGVPIPFEGSIDYGPPFGEWNLDMFFKEYQDESYLWEHDDNLVPEFYPKGTREGIPLWWFIFQYGFNDEGKLDKGMLYKALDKYFALKGRTGDEARAELSKFMELYYLPDHWVEWLSEYEVEG